MCWYLDYVDEWISWIQIVSKNFQNGALDKKADIDSMGINGFDSAGLGIFDAFFASFSMILVSEVCAFNSICFFTNLYLTL